MSFKLRYSLLPLLLIIAIVLPFIHSPIRADSTPIELVSVSSTGQRGDRGSGYWGATISADGNTVVFTSDATNLVPGDTNHVGDIFVYDRQTGQTSRVNFTTAGNQMTEFSAYNPSISGDGRYVVFQAEATNPVSNGSLTFTTIYLYDRVTGITSSASTNASGDLYIGYNPTISANGRYVAFESPTLAIFSPMDRREIRVIRLKDLQTGQLTIVDGGLGGVPSDGNAYLGRNPISADGRFVTFESLATNLLTGDTNNSTDVFLADVQTGQISRVSVGMNGQESNGDSTRASISPDGRYVTFKSTADNLVPGDTNGVGDIFVYDTQTGETTRVNLTTNGEQFVVSSNSPVISVDGRYVVYETYGITGSGQSNGITAMLVYDLETGVMAPIAPADGGLLPYDNSYFPSVSSDGQYVAFVSLARHLVPTTADELHDNVYVSGNPLYTVPVVVTPDPEGIAPTENYFTSLPISLTWGRVTKAVTYEVQVDTTDQFSAPISFTPNVNALYVTIDTLNDGTYYWRVHAQDHKGNWGQWSTTQLFVLNTSP